MRVLVIEDDVELAEAIAVGLRREQLAVDLAFDGKDGLERALVTGYDVIVLDRDLPGLHGDEVCRELVKDGCRSRVLMLTAAATIEDRVDGLGRGADDYLPKPFAFAELVARIRALLRRAQPALPPVLECADIRLDPAQRTASRKGRQLDLGPKEFGVLELQGTRCPCQRLDPARRRSQNPGQLLSKGTQGASQRSTASTRRLSPSDGGSESFPKILATCFSTAPPVTTSALAMPAFDRPSAISASTSRSRGVSEARPPG
jgi:DNA-binding response OmpR family regulator